MLTECSNIWFDKSTYEEAETKYYLWLQEKLYGIKVEDSPAVPSQASTTKVAAAAPQPVEQKSNDKPKGPLSAQIAATRQQIKETLASGDMATASQVDELKKTVNYLVDALKKVELRMSSLETICNCGGEAKAKAAPAPAAAADDDDDVDLFGSDDDEEANAEREERLKAYAEKKSKKPALIAKSSIVLDVKPWADDTDMDALKKCVISIEMDGLVWGASKLMPVGYGIQKLQICCVVEDDKVSIDELTEKITEFEEYVQSVDIAAFNKV